MSISSADIFQCKLNHIPQENCFCPAYFSRDKIPRQPDKEQDNVFLK